MTRERAVLLATTAILLGVTLASGPLVGVSLTDAEPFAPGNGTADVTVAELPETATLERGAHGAGVYYLRAEPVAVEVADVAGQPFLGYELHLPALGFTSSSLTFLDGETAGTVRLQFEPATLEADRIDDDADAYDGVLRVVVTDDRGRRAVAERNVTVEVTG